MTEKRFTLIECNGNIEDGCTQIVYDGGESVFELLDLLNELHEENNRFKQAFEKTMEDAFDRNMDSKIAEEVIDYIHDSFYEFLKLEDLE